MEHLKYAGLRIEDEAALVEAQAEGAEWLARDKTENSFLCGFENEPRLASDGYWERGYGDAVSRVFVISRAKYYLNFVSSDRKSPVNIDLALAQIAEMKTAQKPRTNQDALLKKWQDVDELAAVKANENYDEEDGCFILPDLKTTLDRDVALEQWKAWLLSPAEDGK